MIDLQVIPALREDDCDQLDIGSVREFPRFGYSMKEVRRAGEVIAGELPWTDENQPEIRDAFQVANNWRDVHAYAVRWTDEAVHPNFQPTYYLIEFDNVTREVSIIPSSAPLWAVEAYGTAESGDNRTGVDSKNIVLVEADKIENLKNA